MSKGWRVQVSGQGGAEPKRETRVRAENWVGALRSARQRWGEPPNVPAGASCTVAPDGVVTVMDATSRRRFTLQQETTPNPSRPLAKTVGYAAEQAATDKGGADVRGSRRRKLAQTVAMIPEAAVNQSVPPPKVVGKPAAPARPLNQTVAYEPEPRPSDARDDPGRGAALDAIVARQRRRQRSNTVAFDRSALPHRPPSGPPPESAPAPGPQRPSPRQSIAPVTRHESVPRAQTAPPAGPATVPPAAAPVTPPAAPLPGPPRSGIATTQPVSPGTFSAAAAAQNPSAPNASAQNTSAQNTSTPVLELLLARDEAPSEHNPLTYRERAFFVAPGATIGQAEAGLRQELSRLQEQLQDAPLGQFCSLGVFDHRWEGEPQAPPLVVIEWKDWKGEADVDYPAAAVARQPNATGESGDDRLEVAFEALQGLSGVSTAGAAMELAIAVTEEVIPTQAVSACLYDSDTDQLRFVAASGPGAAKRRGTAIPSHRGLLGLAFAHGGTTTVIGNVGVEPVFDASIDGRPEVEAHNMLLRPLAMYRQPLGMLQLINRTDGTGFSEADVNVINYIAERLAETVAELRGRSLG